MLTDSNSSHPGLRQGRYNCLTLHSCLMGRTDRWLQMNRLSSRNKQLNFKISGNFLMILEESVGSMPQRITESCQHLIGRTWRTIGY
jgi:hypothetical protein